MSRRLTVYAAEGAAALACECPYCASPLCRAAYTEKVLKTAVLTGTKQYVILGAGMDTFAFREPEFLAKHRVFEVDHPLTQADKLERITRAGWTVPDNLNFVPVDFTKDSLMERLIAAGFDPSAKSFFSWLGVTYYLSAEAIDAMLSALSGLCADGSSLVFDYPDENFFDAPERHVQNTIMMAKAGGKPMKSAFSYSELEKLLEKHSCASLLYANGVSLKEIQEWLGHSDIATTSNIYTHLNFTSKVASANAIMGVYPSL